MYNSGLSRPKSRFTNLASWTVAIGLTLVIFIYGPGALLFKLNTPKAEASALSFICAASAATTSVASCSGESTGDLMIVTSGTQASGTAPTLLTGFTNINTATIGSGSPSSRIALRVAWCVAGSGSCPTSSGGSGTWSGASAVSLQVYRGQAASPIGNNAPSTGSGTTSVTFAADTLSVADGSSWFVGSALRNTGDAKMATAPSGMTNRTSAPATPIIGAHDTNAPTSSNWPSTSVSGFSGSASYASMVVEIKAAPTITVGNFGTQVSSMSIPSTANFTGGALTFVRDIANTNVTSIKVTENGTVNAASNLANLVLYYKQEASCESTFPSSGTTQFNSTAGSFSGTGPYTSTVTGTMSVGTTQVCIYLKVDVGSGAGSGDTALFQIANPSTDVVAAVGTVSPASAVALSGSITLILPGPTTDQLLRGGGWFNGGTKQSFYWAN